MTQLVDICTKYKHYKFYKVNFQHTMTHVARCVGYLEEETNVARSYLQAVSVCGASSKLPVESGAPQTVHQDLMKTHYRVIVVPSLPSCHYMTG